MPTNPFSSGPKGYKSKNAPMYEQGAYEGIGNLAGARQYTDSKGNTQYDFSGAFNPVNMSKDLLKGYDMSGINSAMSGFKNPTRFGRPSVFSFKGLPGEYGASAYQAQAGNIRREGAGQLEKARESVGVRRPGLLMKMAEDFDRSQGERLAGADADINRYVMDKGVDLGVQEQTQNAEEKFRREQAQADEKYRYLQGLLGAGQAKTGMESGLLENERAYGSKPLEYLMSLFSNAAGLNNQSAQIAAQNRASTLGFLGGLI